MELALFCHFYCLSPNSLLYNSNPSIYSGLFPIESSQDTKWERFWEQNQGISPEDLGKLPSERRHIYFMGGYGSGRWGFHSKKTTVEDSLSLSASRLVRENLLQPNTFYQGHWQWTIGPWNRLVASCQFTVDTRDEGFPSLRLQYRWGNGEYDYEIALETTPVRFGGVRWWFLCPYQRNGKVCQRRVDKLYSPPESRYFGCRQCQELTYQSSQMSDKRISLLLKNPAQLEALLQKETSERTLKEMMLLLKVGNRIRKTCGGD